jgi:hypothetical protein
MKVFRLVAVTALVAGGLSMAAPLPAGSVVPSSGAVAIWTFDELTGPDCADQTVAAIDHSGRGNTATLGSGSARASGVAPVPYNECSLNSGGGATQYAEAADSPSLDQTGDFSVAGWAFWEPATPPGLAFILSKDDASTARSNYNLGTWDSYAFFSIAFDGTPVAGTPTKGTAGCDAGGCYIKGESLHYQSAYQQHHVAGVFAGGTMSVYVDGVLDGQVAVTGGSPVANDDSVLVGQRKYSSNGWNGRLDEIRIYNRALGGSDVAALADYSKFAVALSPASEINMSGGSHTVTGTLSPNLGYIPVDFTATGRNAYSNTYWTGDTGMFSYPYTDNNGLAGVYDSFVAKVDGATGTKVGTAVKYWVNGVEASKDFCALSQLPLATQQVTKYAVEDGMLYSRDVQVTVPASAVPTQNVCLYFANVSGGTLNIPSGTSFAAFSTPKGVTADFADLGFGYAGFLDQTDFLGVISVSGITLQKNGLINNTHLTLTFNDGSTTYTIPVDLHFTAK